MSLNKAPQTAKPAVAPILAKDRRRPGRPDHVSARLVPLLRTPETAGMPAPIGWAEDACLATLRQLDLLDTAPTEAFDRITRMACEQAPK